MSEHTDLPWNLESTEWGFVITGAEGRDDVCALRDIGNRANKANARHIVHCVNNHESLVEVLRELCLYANDGDVPCWLAEWDEARTLLAALEAEKGGEL